MTTTEEPRLEEEHASRAAGSDPEGEGAARSLAALVSEIREIRDHLDRLARIEVDRARSKLRRLLHDLTWLALGVVVGITAAMAAVVYGLAGLTAGLSELFGGRLWAGRLVGALVVLVGVSLWLAVVHASRRRRALRRMKQTYERPGDGPVRGPTR